MSEDTNVDKILYIYFTYTSFISGFPFVDLYNYQQTPSQRMIIILFKGVTDNKSYKGEYKT